MAHRPYLHFSRPRAEALVINERSSIARRAAIGTRVRRNGGGGRAKLRNKWKAKSDKYNTGRGARKRLGAGERSASGPPRPSECGAREPRVYTRRERTYREPQPFVSGAAALRPAHVFIIAGRDKIRRQPNESLLSAADTTVRFVILGGAAERLARHSGL